MQTSFLRKQKAVIVALLVLILAVAVNAFAESQEQIAAARACRDSARKVAPYGNGQLDSFCQLATFDNCLKENAGTTAYEKEKQIACDRLKATALALGRDPNACDACN